jgi:DNA topoisomerase-6 subunit B
MSIPNEKYKSLSAAEFFKKYPELTGFSNPARALYQTIRELVENSLDATDVHGILPTIKISINKVMDNDDIYLVSVEDNGIGIPPNNVPAAFAKVLYSSKYVLRQTRGMYGLGIKAAVLYSQMYTGQPVEVVSAPLNSSRVYFFKLQIDISQNEPVIITKGSAPNRNTWHGTLVKINILGDWGKSKQRIFEYIKRTAIITPYAEFFYRDAENHLYVFRRLTNKMPLPPKTVKPHPYGVDIELLKELIREKEESVVLNLLRENFQGIGEVTAKEVLERAGIGINKKNKNLTQEEIKKLADVLRTYEKFRPPSSDALSSIGEELIKIGLKETLNAEFVEAVSRSPKVYSGHPFIVEAGVAYGGKIELSDEPQLLRYANKIPLLYDEKSDVTWKVVSEIDWKRYGVEFPAPLVIMVHVCSTKIPYKSTGKESISDVIEIEKEIKNAVSQVARKLKDYLTQLKKREEAKKRLLNFLKYSSEVANSLAYIKTNGDEKKIKDEENKLRRQLIEIIKTRLGAKEEIDEVVKKLEVVIG